MKCKIPGCQKSVFCREWCAMHYARWKRHGDPLKTLRRVGAISWEFMLANSIVNPDTGCIEWQKGRSCGYGQVTNRGRPDRAHRASYKLNKGTIPEGLCVLHSCDNKICINPEHLWLGTLADNVADMVSKNRHVGYRRKNGLSDRPEI